MKNEDSFRSLSLIFQQDSQGTSPQVFLEIQGKCPNIFVSLKQQKNAEHVKAKKQSQSDVLGKGGKMLKLELRIDNFH